MKYKAKCFGFISYYGMQVQTRPESQLKLIRDFNQVDAGLYRHNDCIKRFFNTYVVTYSLMLLTKFTYFHQQCFRKVKPASDKIYTLTQS